MSRRHRKLDGLSRTEMAAHWFIRNDAGNLGEEERRTFEHWLASDDNYEAYQDVQRTWSAFDAADADVTLQSMRRVALAEARKPRVRVWGAAAALAVCIGAGLLATVTWRESPVPSDASTHSAAADEVNAVQGVRYTTAPGELRNVELGDGTRVAINTDTVLYVSYSGEERLIALVRGQAYFEVAKDPERPFVVEAYQRRVTAIGTAFEVELGPERFRVLLVEGSVRVDPVEARVDSVGALGSDYVLESGQGLVIESGAADRIVQFDVERELRWRDGYVEFDDEPLRSVLIEMNRYFVAPVVMQDRSADDLRVSGIFKTSSRDEFLAIISELLPVRVDTNPRKATEPVELVPL